MTTTPQTTQLSEKAADLKAEAWLFATAALGSLACLIRVAIEEAYPGAWLPFPGAELGWAVIPALLVLVAYLLTAHGERHAGIRQQRGALAALVGLAVLLIPISAGLIFSPVYGLALLLLALRTRNILTAVFGALAFFASIFVGMLSPWQWMLVFALVTVSGGANAVRCWLESSKSSDSSHYLR